VSPLAAGALTSFAVLAMLATNQIFHGGLWGTLRNDSVRPRIDVLDAHLSDDGELQVTFERPVGPETYGAFVVDLRVLDAHGRLVRRYDAATLAALSPAQVSNRWLVQVRPGPHGLGVPLGARATITLTTPESERALLPGPHRIELEDVSGARWSRDVDIETKPGPLSSNR